MKNVSTQQAGRCPPAIWAHILSFLFLDATWVHHACPLHKASHQPLAVILVILLSPWETASTATAAMALRKLRRLVNETDR